MSVWVSFLYTVVFRDPSDCGMIIVSRNGIAPSGFASSDVNWMCGSKLLIWLKNSSFLAESKMTQASSMYLFYIFGGCLAVLMAFTSKSSMKRLATMGLMGDPMAAPLICS